MHTTQFFDDPKASLLDATNLQGVAQYYLLENLAVGLLRDEQTTQGGLRGLLATSWYHPAPTEWRFRLRQDLAWSDGSPVTDAELADNFRRLNKLPPRHIVYLRHLVDVKVIAGELVMKFDREVGAGLLGELSLADASLLRATNLTGDWRVTSGPYSVQSFDRAQRQIILEANAANPLYSPEMPQRITLTSFTNREDLLGAFTKHGIDLWTRPNLSFRNVIRDLEDNAPAKLSGAQTWIYFFAFGEQNTLANSDKARREFAALVHEAYSEGSPGGSASYIDQMVPKGFAGRLDSALPVDEPIQELRGQTLKINLDWRFRDQEALSSKLQAVAKRHDVVVEYLYNDIDAYGLDHDDFALLRGFKGNQKDPLGSWSFLFDSSSGEMARFRSEIEPLFAKSLSNSEADADAALQQIHKTVLDRAFVVPFFADNDVILASDRLDLSRIAPLDLRERYYDVRFK